MAISPAARTTSDRTTANTGRSMKNREKRTGRLVREVELLPGVRRGGRRRHGQHGSVLRGDLHPWPHAQQSIDHDVVARLEPCLDDTKAVDNASEADRSILERAVGLEDENEL